MTPEYSCTKGKGKPLQIGGSSPKPQTKEVVKKPKPSDLKTRTDKKWHETRRGK